MKQLPWQRKRKGQGYGYTQVVREIKRRAAGNYLFSKEENALRLERALAEVALLYKLSATLHDFKQECQDLGIALLEQGVLGDSLRIMMDPFPLGGENDSIMRDELIDKTYPGTDCRVERGEGHMELSLNKKTAA